MNHKTKNNVAIKSKIVDLLKILDEVVPKGVIVFVSSYSYIQDLEPILSITKFGKTVLFDKKDQQNIF